jgi:hypothetical protein
MRHQFYRRGTRRLNASCLIALCIFACRQFPESAPATDLIKEGKQMFRDDTFGNENFWTDTANSTKSFPVAFNHSRRCARTSTA